MPNKTYLPDFPLYLHQLKALTEMHNGCVLKGGVGSGKSFTGLVYYVREESPKDLYVITTAQKRDDKDWEKDAILMGISNVSRTKEMGKLTVDSWNNLPNYQDITGAFFIFDEQRALGKGEWAKALIKLAKSNHWIMLSATPGDNWNDYATLFIANGFYKNRTEFNKRHVIFSQWSKYPKIEGYRGTAVLAKRRNQILVPMESTRHTKRIIKQIFCSYDLDDYIKVWRDRWNIFEEQPIKDIAEAFRLVRKISATDQSRLDELSKILSKHRKLIVFYNFDYELEALRSLMNSLGKPYSEWNGHFHQEIPSEKTWVYLVQYAAGAEAWNCTETDALCFYSLPYSHKKFEQAQGRIDRINTPFTNLYYYVLMSDAPVERGIWKAIQEQKNFDEQKFISQEKNRV